MPWLELGAEVTGASLSSQAAVSTPQPGCLQQALPSVEVWEQVAPCGSGWIRVRERVPGESSAGRCHVCGRVCRVRHWQKSPPCPWALNQAPS